MNALFIMLYIMGVVYWIYIPIVFLTIWCCFCCCMKTVDENMVGSTPGIYNQPQTTVIYQQATGINSQQVVYG